MLYNSTSQVDGSRNGLENVAERLGDLDLLGIVALLLAQEELLPAAVGHDDSVSVLSLALDEAVHDSLQCWTEVPGQGIKGIVTREQRCN